MLYNTCHPGGAAYPSCNEGLVTEEFRSVYFFSPMEYCFQGRALLVPTLRDIRQPSMEYLWACEV